MNYTSIDLSWCHIVHLVKVQASSPVILSTSLYITIFRTVHCDLQQLKGYLGVFFQPDLYPPHKFAVMLFPWTRMLSHFPVLRKEQKRNV